MDVDIDRVKDRLRETFILLYNNDLNAAKQVTIEGLLGITLNNDHIVLVNINENLSSDATETRLSIGRSLPKTAVKRPFLHKNVRTRPFKRYKTADSNTPFAKASENPAAKQTSEDASVQSIEEINSSHDEISEKIGEESESSSVTPILSLSDHLGEGELPSAVKSEPVADEMPVETDDADAAVEEGAGNKENETANANETLVTTLGDVGNTQQERDASVQHEARNDAETEAKTEIDPKTVKAECEKSDSTENKPAKQEETKPPAQCTGDDSLSLKNTQSNTSSHGDTTSNHSAMVTSPATRAQSSAQPTSGHISAGPSGGHLSASTTTGHSYTGKPSSGDMVNITTTGHSYTGKPSSGDMVNSTDTNSVNWFQMPDAPNCSMTTDTLGENMMADASGMNNTDSMVTDTSQLFAATYQVLEGEEDGILSANQHGFYDNKPQGSQAAGGTQMNQANFQNAITNSQHQSVPHSLPATCSSGTGNVLSHNYTGNKQGHNPSHSSAHNVPTKAPEPPKLAHPSPHNPLGHRASQPPYPGMWPNQARVPVPPHNRPPGVGNMPPYGSPVPPRSFPTNYPIRSEATQAKSFENQFSDFIRARHGSPYQPRGPNMQDPSRPQMQSQNSAQNFQSPNVTMNKYQNVNRYPFHQSLGPASGAIRDLACRVPTPPFPRGPPMMQGNVGHQPLQHQPPSGQPPYNQGPLPPQAQQQQQSYLGQAHPQWNQPHGNIPLNHQMMSQRHSTQTPPHSQAQNFHPQQQQMMQAAARNEGSPVPQIASPSLSQQAISNIPPIDPPPIQHRATPEKTSTPKKKKSSPKISRESTQESVKIQEEKALLENPHANVHIGHPKGKKCKFHRTKNSKDKYTVFGCRACNVALCKECHDEYHNELGESHQK